MMVLHRGAQTGRGSLWIADDRGRPDSFPPRVLGAEWCLFQNSYVGALTSTTSKCDLLWRKLFADGQVEVRS